MRLGRFSSWYDDDSFGKSRYLDELERITKYTMDEFEGDYCNPIADIKWRCRLMVAFNPLSPKMQRMRFKEEEYEKSLTPNQLFERFPARLRWGGWTRKQWQYYYRARFNRDEYKKLDRENREEQRKRGLEARLRRDEGSHSSAERESGEEMVLKDRLDREEWHRYYPEGIPPLGKSLFMFEIEMGHLWSEESLIDPRGRFQGWDGAEHNWELSRKVQMDDRAVAPPPRPRSRCSSCGE